MGWQSILRGKAGSGSLLGFSIVNFVNFGDFGNQSDLNFVVAPAANFKTLMLSVNAYQAPNHHRHTNNG